MAAEGDEYMALQIIFVSGMSGAGKSTVLKVLEDRGAFCVDNLPIPLIDKFVALTMENSTFTKVAIGVDIRSGSRLKDIEKAFDTLKKKEIPYKLLFLEANDATLIRRFKETRRTHPLAKGSRIEEGIAGERLMTAFLKKEADYVLDTSRLLTRELKSQVEQIFLEDKDFKSLMITILSFGFKYGIPKDSDLLFDVRFLPNPYYVPELKELSGLDKPVSDFVMKQEASQIFIDKLYDMVSFLIPNYIREGKNQLVISIGCTGGRHRSVTLAGQLYKRLEEASGDYGVKIQHLDLARNR